MTILSPDLKPFSHSNSNVGPVLITYSARNLTKKKNWAATSELTDSIWRRGPWGGLHWLLPKPRCRWPGLLTAGSHSLLCVHLPETRTRGDRDGGGQNSRLRRALAGRGRPSSWARGVGSSGTTETGRRPRRGRWRAALGFVALLRPPGLESTGQEPLKLGLCKMKPHQ
jgi:hypothetical protein